MKLEPKAKPVRIRIKSGGEEHFSLDSLKKNFSVDDLWEAVVGKSLSKWLRMQNENELADKVDGFCNISKPTEEEYVKFCSLFFEDASISTPDSLFDYYRNKGLTKNLNYAFLNLIDSLSYERGKMLFNSNQNLKSTVYWIDFFERKLYQLSDDDKIECLKILLALYKEHGDAEKKNYINNELATLLFNKACTDDQRFSDFLNLCDYDSLKSLYDNIEYKNRIDDSYWISAFGRCQNILADNKKGECFFVLYELFLSKGDREMAQKYLKKSADNDFYKAKDILKALSFPELEKFVKQHQILQSNKLDYIAAKWYQAFDKNCRHVDYYLECYYCMNMAAEIVLNIGNKYNTIREIKARRYKQMMGNTKEKALIFTIAGLACEERMDNAALFSDYPNLSLPFEYQIFAKAKTDNKHVIIHAENNLVCNTKDDLPIQQMFFFMRTYGQHYAFDYI